MVSYSCVWHMRSWTVNSHLWEEIYLSHPSYLQDKTNHSIASRTEQNRTGNCFSNLSVLTWQQIVFCHTSSSSWTLEQKRNISVCATHVVFMFSVFPVKNRSVTHFDLRDSWDNKREWEANVRLDAMKTKCHGLSTDEQRWSDDQIKNK